jgi:PAS domain S-box/PAS domain S-box/PAS domain S-box/PAS domain S-box
MGAGAENQGWAMNEARVQELEAELARVKAQLRTTVERHEALMEEVREKGRFIEQLAELTPVVITVFDLDTQHDTYISPDVVKMHGYTPDELARMKDLFSDLLHPEDVATVREHFARLKWAGNGEVRELEYRIRHRDGEWRWLRSRHLPFARDDQGEVRQVVTATLDITERKHAELALSASEERFRSYFELGLIGMAITSPEKGLVEVNDEICRILGYERDELLRMTWAELTHPDDLAADVVHFNRVIAGEIDGYALDKRWIHKDGRVIDAKISVKALRRADGSVDYFVALLEDITERKQSENERQKFVSLAENSNDFIGICDMDFIPVYVNEAGARMVGLENREAVRQLSVGDFFFAEDRDYVIGEFFPRVLRDGAGELEMRLRHFQTNEPLWMIFTAFLITNADGQTIGLGTVSRNITERKQAEERLRTSEEWLRQATEAGRVFVWEVDLLKQTAKLSDNVERVLGFPLPTNLKDNFNALHPEDRERQREVVEQAIATGGRYDEEHRISNPSGGASVWVRALGAVVNGTDGKPARIVGMTQNITERKQAEEVLREAHDELERRVAERTEQLSIVNEDLKKEIIERERVEEERRQLLHRIIFAQEDERRRIARDLHDHFGQQVTTLILQLSLLKTANGATEAQREHISTLETIAKQFDADIDFLVRELRPTALDDLGLQSALTSHVKAWSKHSGVRAEFHASGMEKDRLTPEIETTLYRIVQEALNNVAKHARASKVDILIERRADSVSLIVEDNGVGFDPAKIHGAGNGGFGLTGMRERAALASGTVVIEARPGKGVTVIARIPAPHVTSGGEMA